MEWWPKPKSPHPTGTLSTKILTELPKVFEKVAGGLNRQKEVSLEIVLESPVADPGATIERFNSSCPWGEEKAAWSGGGHRMQARPCSMLSTPTPELLPWRDCLRNRASGLQRVGGEVLGMLRYKRKCPFEREGAIPESLGILIQKFWAVRSTNFMIFRFFCA